MSLQDEVEMQSQDLGPKASIARFGPYQADFGQHELRRNGVRVRLQGQPFKLLRILLENQDRIVTRNELRQKLWPGDIFVKFDACLNTALNKLRYALREEADQAMFIETIPREGYRFIAPISWTGLPASREVPSTPVALASATAEGTPFAKSHAIGLVASFAQLDWRRRLPTLLPVAFLLTTIFLGIPASRILASKQHKTVVLVTPFDNLNADGSKDYLSEAVTEEMITLLGAKYPRRLSVLSKQSAARLNSSRRSLDQVAREFGIDYLLAGSVRRSKDHVRVTAQLFRATDQTSAWTGAYDLSLGDDMVATESQISARIAESVALEIAGLEGLDRQRN